MLAVYNQTTTYVIVIQLPDLISVNAPNSSYAVESLLPSKQTLIMINKSNLSLLVNAVDLILSLAEHKKGFGRRWEQCYCQQCVFPGGKHIVWPNAATIGNIAHSLVLLRSVKTRKREKWTERVCRSLNCDLLVHATRGKVKMFHSSYRLDLWSWRSAWQSRAVACIFLHGWINTTSRRGTGLLYYPLNIIIDD